MSDFHAGNLQAKAGRRRFSDFPTQIGADPKRSGLLDLESFLKGIISLKFDIDEPGVWVCWSD